MSSRLGRWVLIALVPVTIWLVYELVQRQRGFTKASELATFGLWGNARATLGKYLQLHPGDERARLFMAELWVKDDAIPGDESAPQAIAHLDRIPADSPFSNSANILKGRLQFFILHKPFTAEKLFREVIRRDENSLEAHQLLCNVFQMTGRYHLMEPWFWRTYDLSPPAERAVQLRYWYMSQFFPLTVADEMDQLMGFSAAATKSRPVELIRFSSFREAEADEPLARAALARWMERVGKLREALEVMQPDKIPVEDLPTDPFFLATLIDLLIGLGEFSQAEERFQQWPGPTDGFDYWRIKAILLEQSQGDFAAALQAYDRALEIWPGPADWRLMHRKAGCLARAKRNEEAITVRARAQAVEQLMKNEVHQRLRYILGSLDNPDYLREMADFYRKLGRTRETAAWMREAGSRIADTLE